MHPAAVVYGIASETFAASLVLTVCQDAIRRPIVLDC
jgi:hypothetical protein